MKAKLNPVELAEAFYRFTNSDWAPVSLAKGPGLDKVATPKDYAAWAKAAIAAGKKARKPGFPDAGYTAQEEIHLNVTIRNFANQDAPIPIQAGHPSTWVLKYPIKGTELIKEFKPGTQLPWQRVSDHRTATMPYQDQGPEEMAMVLHTVVVDMEKHRMTLVWRGCSYYGGLEAMKDFTNLEYGVKEDRHG